MRRARVAIVTCNRGLSEDEDRFATIEALDSRGIDASLAVWDDCQVAWSSFDLVVIRSTWDYPEDRTVFLEWAAGIGRLANPYDVIEWNTDKRYLADLQATGLATVPTTWIEPGSGFELPEGELVVKPAVGTGARGSGRYGAGEREAATNHAASLLAAGHVVMAQPYVEGFERRGECSLVYLGDHYSHSIYKSPLLTRRGPFVVGTLPTRIIEPATPTDEELRFAETVLDSMPFRRQRLLYARVDIVPGADGPLLVELEVTKPRLYLRHGTASADLLASAIEESLDRT